MKKIILFSLTTGIIIASNAQTKFGLKAGVNVSSLTGKDVDAGDFDSKAGFYAGLFNFSNTDRWVHALYKPLDQTWVPLPVPNIWGSEWVPNLNWVTVNVQFWSNIERAVRRTTDQLMTRTITGNRVQDRIQTTVPLTPPDNRGRRTSRLRTQVSFNTKTRINANINGQNVTVIFSQTARRGRKLATTIRVKLKTQHREYNSERLKIFGIKTFITRKI